MFTISLSIFYLVDKYIKFKIKSATTQNKNKDKDTNRKTKTKDGSSSHISEEKPGTLQNFLKHIFESIIYHQQ
jgi:hypothetical protein